LNLEPRTRKSSKFNLQLGLFSLENPHTALLLVDLIAEPKVSGGYEKRGA